MSHFKNFVDFLSENKKDDSTKVAKNAAKLAALRDITKDKDRDKYYDEHHKVWRPYVSSKDITTTPAEFKKRLPAIKTHNYPKDK